MELNEIKEIAMHRHVWEEDSNQRSVAGDFYDTVCNALDEALLLIAQPQTIHLSRGLTVMITETGKYLCLQPRLKDRSRTAWEIWVTHTEDRLKDRIAERLVTKGDCDERCVR